MRALFILLAACASTPKPAAKTGSIAELDYFVGHWRADAKNPTNGKSFVLDYTIEPTLQGKWYAGTGHAAALGLDIHDLWGKDAASGEIVRTIFDSAQNFGTVRSKGWSGDVLVFEGEVASTGGRVTVRETITKRGANAFDAVWEMKTDDTWTAYSIEKLRRQ